jgi:cystathionine beta-lyase
MSHRYDALNLSQLKGRPLAKWTKYDPDVLPLWVADMDFPVSDQIREAIRSYADGDWYGYPQWTGMPGVREAICLRAEREWGWSIEPEQVRIIPGIIAGLFSAVDGFTSHRDGVLALTPIYPPFKMATVKQGRTFQEADLAETDDGFVLDEEALDAAIDPSTRLLMLCQPHNPTGRSFTESEMEALAQRVVDHRLFVVSDELHADLTFSGKHRPFATISDEIARRTVTLVGPTKAFNIAGLKVGFAVAEDPATLARFDAGAIGRAMGVPSVAQLAARAALVDSDAWFADTMAYLDANRRHVDARIRNDLPGVKAYLPEATYLTWMDFRATPFADQPGERLVERARVGLNEGSEYGAAGRGFARLNFATTRAIVDEALDRIASALRDA